MLNLVLSKFINSYNLKILIAEDDEISEIGQLAGGIAYEINNPIGVILGFAQSIVKRIKEDDQLHMPLKSNRNRCKRYWKRNDRRNKKAHI